MFFMGLTQTGITINVPHMLREQVYQLVYVMKRCIEDGHRGVEATEAAETAWQTTMAQVSAARRPFQEACTPGYYNSEGRVDDRRSAIGTGWFLPSTYFFNMWAQWRAAGRMEGLNTF
jgi:cyclohexanone monooxygenase